MRSASAKEGVCDTGAGVSEVGSGGGSGKKLGMAILEQIGERGCALKARLLGVGGCGCRVHAGMAVGDRDRDP